MQAAAEPAPKKGASPPKRRPTRHAASTSFSQALRPSRDPRRSRLSPRPRRCSCAASWCPSPCRRP
eukprot:11286463-Alexandrium_andersonii.AAC.1